MPNLYFDVMKLFNVDNPDLNRIAGLVSMDMGMSAMILHFVNSGYFGPATATSNPERAVRWLGLETVHDLIVRHRLSCSFDSTEFHHFSAMNLWKKSISASKSARVIALAHSKDSVIADDAFAAALFQEIGQLVLATVLGHFYDSVIGRSVSRGEPLCRTEREMIGATHAEVGAYILGLWGMPDAVVSAVAGHHMTESGDTIYVG